MFRRCELGSMIIDPVDGTILAVPDTSEKGYLDVIAFPPHSPCGRDFDLLLAGARRGECSRWPFVRSTRAHRTFFPSLSLSLSLPQLPFTLLLQSLCCRESAFFLPSSPKSKRTPTTPNSVAPPRLSELPSASPHTLTFSLPLFVGLSWTLVPAPTRLMTSWSL